MLNVFYGIQLLVKCANYNKYANGTHKNNKYL